MGVMGLKPRCQQVRSFWKPWGDPFLCLFPHPWSGWITASNGRKSASRRIADTVAVLRLFHR